MTTVRFSAPSSASAVTSLVVSLGGTPTVGDLIVVFLGVSNEIVTHPPGYNTTNQWFQADSHRLIDSSTTSTWFHTWNASDSGDSVEFTLSPAPSLGVGDKDVSFADVVAVGMVLAGPVGLKEHSSSNAYDDATLMVMSPLKKPSTTVFFSGFTNTGDTLVPSGPHTLVQAASINNLFLRVDKTAAAVGFSPTMISFNQQVCAGCTFAVQDNPDFFYNPPIIQEGPVSENRLFYRYKLQKFYTVLNNAGVFTAQRYLSTDQVNSADAVYTNNSPVTPAVRAAILAAGIGGEFISQ